MAFDRAQMSVRSDPVIEVARRGAVRLALVGGGLMTLASALQLLTGDATGATTMLAAAPVTLLAAFLYRQKKPNVVLLLGLISLTALVAETYAAVTNQTQFVAGVGSEVVVIGLGILAVFVARERPWQVAGGFLLGTLAIVEVSQVHMNGISFEMVTDAVVAISTTGTLMYLVIRVMDSLSETQMRYSDLASVIPVATLELDLTAAIRRIEHIVARVAKTGPPKNLNALLADLLPQIRLSFFNDMAGALATKYGTWYDFVVGQNASTFQGEVTRVLAEVTQGATDGAGEFAATQKDGTEQSFIYRWTLGRRPGPNSPVRLVIAATDVSPLRDAEAALAQQLRDRDQFVASVSHELRTPLTSIMGLTEEMVSRPEHFDADEQAELLQIVASETRDVVDIVEDLLVTARAEAGQLKMALVPVDLALEMKRVAELLGGEVEAAGEVWISADPGRLRQVIRNLVSNAHRHGGPNVRMSARSDDQVAVLTVRDDGAPLSERERERIFMPYERADQPGLAESVGLGLHVARLLARQMGGELTYDHDGADTIFRMELPLIEATPAGVSGSDDV